MRVLADIIVYLFLARVVVNSYVSYCLFYFTTIKLLYSHTQIQTRIEFNFLGQRSHFVCSIDGSTLKNDVYSMSFCPSARRFANSWFEFGLTSSAQHACICQRNVNDFLSNNTLVRHDLRVIAIITILETARLLRYRAPLIPSLFYFSTI